MSLGPSVDAHPLDPCCWSPPPLLVWMNVSSLSPWLLGFHTFRFSVSSGCFLFLNCCCPFGFARRHSVSTYASILAGSLSKRFSTDVLQEFLKHVMPAYLVGGTDLFSFTLSNKKSNNSKNNSSCLVWMIWNCIYFFVRLAKSMFLVCHRILVISLCVPWN